MIENLMPVIRADGEVKDLRVLEGQLFVCKGCCCGQVTKGVPEVPIKEFKQQWKERNLRKSIHLTFTGCLGPCSLANVVLVVIAGQMIGFHSINSAAHVAAIYNYIESILACGKYLHPTGTLRPCHFSRFSFDSGRPGI